MILRLSANDLRRLSPRQRNALIRDAHSHVNGSWEAYIATIEGKLKTFEKANRMTSTVMVKRWRSGDLKESPEVSHWLYYLKARDDCKKKSSRSHNTK